LGKEKDFICFLAYPANYPTNQFCRGSGVIGKCKEPVFPLGITVQDLNMRSEGG
jgi:hypothetical protein